ncbi:hypothetical protein MNBD_GAMMA25-1213 [hydrothermal vent metagenome]|uniref:Co-chaperone DjlA N-terminal domain-containing protein n=1 Tax=hydrothermal vent metagenome TaxID=652676 RepID=A0A3B1ANS1_9ZZZZ
MLSKVKLFFDNVLNGSESVVDTGDNTQLAAALLLVEVMNADHNIDEREKKAVQAGLKNIFDLSDEEVREIFEIAEDHAKDVVSLQKYTSILNSDLKPEEKLNLLEQIWRVVLSDDNVDKYEEHLVRQIAELLYIRHSDYIFARERAKSDAG